MPEDGSTEMDTFRLLDVAVTTLFVVELLINIFANSNDGFKPFYTAAANWFDAFIVIMSVTNVIVTYSGGSLPNAKLLRLLRIGRVIRLFKAFKQLQTLLQACACAVVPVCNAFFILLIISAVYAILGTFFFSERQPEYFVNFHT